MRSPTATAGGTASAVWYLLIIAVTAGHIHQKIVVDGPSEQPFAKLADCRRDLKNLKTAKPKRGIVIHMACVPAGTILDYYGVVEPEHLLKGQRWW